MRALIDESNYYLTLCGRVFVKSRVDIIKGRHAKSYERVYPSKQLKTSINNAGYEVVGLTLHGKRHLVSVHRLIASYFIPNPNNLPEVNHKDLNKLNNKVSNLEWCSRKDNLLHAELMGQKRIGSLVGTSILGEEDVVQIKQLIEDGLRQTEIAKMFGVTNHAIHRIAKGHNWSWLTGIGRKVGEECVRS